MKCRSIKILNQSLRQNRAIIIPFFLLQVRRLQFTYFTSVCICKYLPFPLFIDLFIVKINNVLDIFL